MSDGPDVPFNVLMQQAAALKTSQLAAERRKFDAQNEWYRNSLFARQETRDVREAESGEFEPRLKYAQNCKQRGNELFGRGDMVGAICEYEQSLAVFEYFHPIDPDWKKKGIEDRSLEERSYIAKSDSESTEIRALKLSNLLNLSLCYMKSRQWNNSIQAATAALLLDPQNTKALYRRAQALLLPAASGAVQQQQALVDLRAACNIKPDDAVLVSALAELKLSIAEQKRKDKRNFSDFFSRAADVNATTAAADETIHSSSNNNNKSNSSKSSAGSRYSDDAAQQAAADRLQQQHQQQSLTWKDAFVALKDLESAAAAFERDGDVLRAKETKLKISSLQQQIDEYFPADSERDRLAAAALEAQRTGRTAPVASTGSNTGNIVSGSNNDADHSSDVNVLDYLLEPNDAMIADAEQRGVDITDSRVQRILKEINTLRLADESKQTKQQQIPSSRSANSATATAASDVQQRVERYLQQATRSIYQEEAEHIAATLLADLSEAEVNQMLVSRMQYQQQQQRMPGSDTAAAIAADSSLFEWLMQQLAALLGLRLPPRVQLPTGKDRAQLLRQLRDCITADVVDLRVARDRATDALQAAGVATKSPSAKAAATANVADSIASSGGGGGGGNKDDELSESVVRMIEQRYGINDNNSSSGGVWSFLRVLGVGRKGGVQSTAYVFAILSCFLFAYLHYNSNGSKGNSSDNSNNSNSRSIFDESS